MRKLYFPILIIASVLSVHADPINDLAASIKTDYDSVRIKTDSTPEPKRIDPVIAKYGHQLFQAGRQYGSDCIEPMLAVIYNKLCIEGYSKKEAFRLLKDVLDVGHQDYLAIVDK